MTTIDRRTRYAGRRGHHRSRVAPRGAAERAARHRTAGARVASRCSDCRRSASRSTGRPRTSPSPTGVSWSARGRPPTARSRRSMRRHSPISCQDVASTFGLVLSGRVRDAASDERRLRGLGAGAAGRARRASGVRAGDDRVPATATAATLDLDRSFRLDDSREEIGHFLAEAGYLHLEGRVHRAGDGRGVRRARRRDRRGDAGRRRVVVGPHRGRLVRVADPRVQPEVADAAGAARRRTDSARSARSPTTRWCSGRPRQVTAPRGCTRRSASSKASPTSRGTRTARWAATRAGAAAWSSASRSPAPTRAAASSASSPARTGPTCSPSTCAPISTCRGSRCPTQTGDVTVHCSCTLHMSRPPVEARAPRRLHGLRPRAPAGRRRGGSSTQRRSAAPGCLNDQVRRREQELTSASTIRSCSHCRAIRED